KKKAKSGRRREKRDEKRRGAEIRRLGAADQNRAGGASWAASTILGREMWGAGMREYLAAMKGGVPVMRVAEGGAKM
ncbi:CDP-diacylglycerol--glycerol-3-phosphate 3-phosphatidyltransferase, partial [Rhizobium leguminosarum]